MYDSSWRRSNYLALSRGHSPEFARRAADRGVGVFELEDLF